VDISDSELLHRTQKKSCIWDAVSDADKENAPGAVFPAATTSSVSPAANTLVPATDQNMLLRMEQLRIPESLPQEDVERYARLERLKQLSSKY